MSKAKVLFHVSESKRVNSAYSNINNILKVSKDYQITLIFNGDAITEILNSDKLIDLYNHNVDVVGCANSIKTFKINVDEIDSRIRIVASGVIEIIKLQSEEYAYIKR